MEMPAAKMPAMVALIVNGNGEAKDTMFPYQIAALRYDTTGHLKVERSAMRRPVS